MEPSPTQPPALCPTTHVSPQLIQEVLGRATKVLKRSGPLSRDHIDGLDSHGMEGVTMENIREELRSALATAAPSPPPAATPSPAACSLPDGMTLVDSSELLNMKLAQAKAEARAELLQEGAPTKPGYIEVSLLASHPTQIPLMPLPLPPPPPNSTPNPVPRS